MSSDVTNLAANDHPESPDDWDISRFSLLADELRAAGHDVIARGRANRRVDARQHLNGALEMFARMGAQAFAERTRRELVATGEKVRKQSLHSGDELTAQEAQIPRLAGDGLTNQEIGAQLFISTHDWRLRKVFVKLGITSRRQLRTVSWPS